MKDEPIPCVRSDSGSPEFERAMQIFEAMLGGAAADQQLSGMESEHHAHMTIGVCGLIAGYLAGACIIAGTLTDADKRRVGQMLLENFRQGIQIGKDNALANMATEGGEQ